MKRAALAALVIALVLPELARYQGERRLRMVEATLQAIVTRAKDPAPLLRRLSVDAAETRTYAGDWRPLVAAGRASYLAGDYAQAAERFERANAMGERPEIDVNLGAALLKLGETRRAEALFARATKLSPALASEIARLAPAR
ncbi:MAG TPA: tetratricopeptide repeat protein [Thermoanaerobaculia bacterium]|nr:tetratricopeptide repeat protein [Thermoanaerobaculia bacterium]